MFNALSMGIQMLLDGNKEISIPITHIPYILNIQQGFLILSITFKTNSKFLIGLCIYPIIISYHEQTIILKNRINNQSFLIAHSNLKQFL